MAGLYSTDYLSVSQSLKVNNISIIVIHISRNALIEMLKPELPGSEQVLGEPFVQKIGQKFNFPQPSAEVKARGSHQGIDF